MSRYSDHSTVGGQVLAHRVRMMMQNWNIVWIVGKVSFLGTFFAYLIAKWNLIGIWNYLVCLKAVYRSNMTTLPSTLFSHSYFRFENGKWKEVLDYVIATGEPCLFFKTEFESSLIFALKLSICVSIAAMALMALLNKYFGKSLSDSKELISGHEYVKGTKIRRYIKEKSDITLADIPYPRGTECRHTILTGTTGSGKTNVMIELLDQAAAKNEKIVVVDTIGTFVNRYYKKNRDVILNPLAKEHVPWSFLSECTEDTLIRNAASCLVDSGNTNDKFWEEAARIVFVETAKKAIKEGKTTSEFLDILLKMRLEEIEKYLEGTYGYSLMDKRADKMAISIRATLINAISIFDVLEESDSNNFSIKNWITNPDQKGILFLSCTPAQRATLIPIITTWLSIASEYLLHTNPTSERTWFFIDELHNLKRLPKIESSLAEVRKFGGCFVISTQIVSQLNDIYRHEVAKTIMGLCDTKIVMRVPEPETARYMSNFLGEKEEISTAEAISYGANTMRDGVNIAQKTEKKPTVPYGEIMDLKPGEAFIRFSGINIVTKTKFKMHKIDVKDKEEDNKIISLQKYVLENPPAKNSLFLYGIPLNNSVLSRPIYVFDNDISKISELLEKARKLNSKIIVFENDSKFFSTCFKNETDILLNNHKKNGFAWDLLDEFDGDYIRFVRAIIDAVDLDDMDRKNTEKCLLKLCARINGIVAKPTTMGILDKLVFQSFRIACSDLEGLLDGNETDIFKKYIEIRDYLSLKLAHLKANAPSSKEISIKKYLASEKGVLFVSCFGSNHMTKLLHLILKHAPIENTLKIVSNIDAPTYSKNVIINASEFKNFLDLNANIFASPDEINNKNYLGKIFNSNIPNSSVSCMVKLAENERIIAV